MGDQDQEADPGADEEDLALGQRGRADQEADPDPREMRVPRRKMTEKDPEASRDPEASQDPRAETSPGPSRRMRRQDPRADPGVLRRQRHEVQIQIPQSQWISLNSQIITSLTLTHISAGKFALLSHSLQFFHIFL